MIAPRVNLCYFINAAAARIHLLFHAPCEKNKFHRIGGCAGAPACGILYFVKHMEKGACRPLPFLLTDSREALSMNTLPALKLTHFSGHPARGEVYAYVRLYLFEGALRLCVTSFDETPPETARMALCLAFADDETRTVRVVFSKYAEAAVDLPGRTQSVPTILSTGADEQGWYWQREGELSEALLREALGRAPRAGDVLAGNVIAYDESEDAFGAAFPVPGKDAFSPDGFDVFPVVSY